MPPIENSPHKTGKSMLFFTFEMPLFSVMSINSQIYMTKPKQAQKTLSENTGKTFSVIMPPFSSKGGAKLRKWLYSDVLPSHQPHFESFDLSEWRFDWAPCPRGVIFSRQKSWQDYISNRKISSVAKTNLKNTQKISNNILMKMNWKFFFPASSQGRL